MKNFDLVTFLILLAGRVAKRRQEKLIRREADLKAAIAATQAAYQKTVQERVNADWKVQDIKRVA